MKRNTGRGFLLPGLLLTAAVLWSASAKAQDDNVRRFAIIIHGGAGVTAADSELADRRAVVLKDALTTGRNRLQAGDAALDVVEAVVRLLEDAPDFNAGRGAVMAADGSHQLDASIMDGSTHACGAVAGVTTVRHPITLARAVMTETRHVLLSNEGAEKFGDELGSERIERVTNDWFTTPSQKARFERLGAAVEIPESARIGTVGCVVLDTHGNIAAATSTGGLMLKKFGRVGDSPIIGAGTYADNASCGVSCTGVGEDFIRNSIAFHVSARMKYGGSGLQEAVDALLADADHPIKGGIIAVDRDGNIAAGFNSGGMIRAAADHTGRFEIHADGR